MVSNKKLQFKVRFDPKWILNKYFISLAVFAVWMIFFDHHNVRDQLRLTETADHLIQEKEKYKTMIEGVKLDQKSFESNKEKYGREKYFLHKPGEEVWIVPDEKE